MLQFAAVFAGLCVVLLFMSTRFYRLMDIEKRRRDGLPTDELIYKRTPIRDGCIVALVGFIAVGFILVNFVFPDDRYPRPSPVEGLIQFISDPTDFAYFIILVTACVVGLFVAGGVTRRLISRHRPAADPDEKPPSPDA